MTDAARRAVDALWNGNGTLPTLARLALTPLAFGYGAVVRARGALYDAGMLSSATTAIPAISVGNLSVGGTGKTPISAWIADELQRRGAHPAIVLRGYGDDEPLVHRHLNPQVPVVVDPDRLRGAARARELGCDIAVLDDAFQHRRARRVADVVLVSADRWVEPMHLMPAGPWRERLGALRRATLVVVTRKAASLERATAIARRLGSFASGGEVAIVHLAVTELRSATDDARAPVEALRGARVRAVTAIGDPTAFRHQLEQMGASVNLTAHPDHHAFTASDVEQLARSTAVGEWMVCTLKDAVKLAPLWRDAPSPLWYVSQRVVVERADAEIERVLELVLGARSDTPYLDRRDSPAN